MKQQSTDVEEKACGLRFSHRTEATPHDPLIVLLHGRAGNRDVMWLFERCLPTDVNIVSFEAHLPDRLGGFSWWDITSTQTQYDLAHAAESLVVKAVQQFVELNRLSPDKIILIGFSQGAALLSVIMQNGTLRSTGVALLAGFIIPSPTPDSPQKMILPNVFIGHGTLDEIVPIARARNGVKVLTDCGYSVTFCEDTVGHKIGVTGMKGLKDWVGKTLSKDS